MTTTVTTRVSGSAAGGTTKRVEAGQQAAFSYTAFQNDSWGGSWGNAWGKTWFSATLVNVPAKDEPIASTTARVSSAPVSGVTLRVTGI